MRCMNVFMLASILFFSNLLIAADDGAQYDRVSEMVRECKDSHEEDSQEYQDCMQTVKDRFHSQVIAHFKKHIDRAQVYAQKEFAQQDIVDSFVLDMESFIQEYQDAQDNDERRQILLDASTRVKRFHEEIRNGFEQYKEQKLEQRHAQIVEKMTARIDEHIQKAEALVDKGFDEEMIDELIIKLKDFRSEIEEAQIDELKDTFHRVMEEYKATMEHAHKELAEKRKEDAQEAHSQRLDEIKQKTHDQIGQHIDRMRSHSDEHSSDIVDRYVIRLESLAEKIDDAEDAEALRSILTEVKDEYLAFVDELKSAKESAVHEAKNRRAHEDLIKKDSLSHDGPDTTATHEKETRAGVDDHE